MAVAETLLQAPGLEAEWRRAAALIEIAETQTGRALPEGFEARFDALQDGVDAARNAGAWAPLRALVAAHHLEALTAFDLDLLALALAPLASPALRPRICALQPALGAAPGLALMQELLMLEPGTDVALLMERLSPAAPLIAGGALEILPHGDEQALYPTPACKHAMLNFPTLGTPPGAERAEAQSGFDALVLPPRPKQRLCELRDWILNRDAIVQDWGGRALGGPLALLAGPSGVGKSYAVACLAGELSQASGTPWVLYRVDLGRIVSKYVGETEKNLNALLDAMHGQKAVLQIDEADGLLGKRGEVSDARDRYANLEVSHMLSRFERHDGPVVLTTNLRGNIDAAFLRRFQVVVDVPAPDATQRAALWAQLLPPNAPRDPGLDTEAMGLALPLTGGAIHNAAIYAAVLARVDGAPIGPAHVARAAWREMSKETRRIRPQELGPFAPYIEDEA